MYPPRLRSAVHINWANIFACEPDWRWNTRTTPLRDYDLWLIAAGRGTLSSSDSTVALCAGDCLLLRPARWYACEHDPGQPLVVLVVHFEFLDRDGQLYYPAAGTIPPLHTHLVDPALIRQLLYRAIESHRGDEQSQANGWLQAALQAIGAECRRRQREAAPVQPHRDAIEQLCQAISERPAHPWRVPELAAQCHLSPDHFSRRFKQYIALTPRQYIKRARLEAARKLLLFSSHSVTRIAQLAGFTDVYHFSRQFRLATGLTPTVFRRRRGV